MQYELSVIDSSHTGHGPTDTRHYAKGKFHSGVGEGLFRLYANRDGVLTGYSWSVTKASEVYTPDERNLVIGRLNCRSSRPAIPATSMPSRATSPATTTGNRGARGKRNNSKDLQPCSLPGWMA